MRSDLAVNINSAGEIESIHRIQNTIENNSYWNDSVFSTTRKIGDTEYILRNDMGALNLFASSYSQLISTNIRGDEKIIYDVNSDQFARVILIATVVIVFICLVLASHGYDENDYIRNYDDFLKYIKN